MRELLQCLFGLIVARILPMPQLIRCAVRRSPPIHATRNTQHATFLRITLHASRFTLLLTTLALPAAINTSALPPPATVTINFERDIKPIFDQSCIRCHGPERPRSRFRLDNREAALKGGDNGIAILPGNSADSPLIHFVARLVEDMEMPPPRQGEPLTDEQIGLLRAWIDQGAPWEDASPPPLAAFSISPTLRWLEVEGNVSRFREIEGMREDWVAGVEQFSFRERIGSDSTLAIEGRVLFRDRDVRVTISCDKQDVGFIRAGYEQWRRYYDDTGGYYRPFDPPAFDLDRNLYLDTGRAWIDFGLALPRWPQMAFGYEYQFRDGAKSTLQWGEVNGKNIYPAAKEIDEQVHIVKFDLTHEFAGWYLKDNARVEFFNTTTRRDNAASFSFGPLPDSVVRIREELTHVQGMNAIRLERQVAEWWLLTGGYLYSRFNGDASLNQATLNISGVPVFGRFWSSEDIVLNREAHIFSVASLFTVNDALSLSLGSQNEWQRQEGFGNVHLDEGDPALPQFFALLPASVHSNLDKFKTMQNVGVRFTQIPFTVLFAEARLEQECIGQFERMDAFEQGHDEAHDTFLRDMDATNDRRDWRAGFSTSPWRWVALSAHYRSRLSHSEYDHRRDIGLEAAGYSAFIRERRIDGDEVQAKLALRPATWLKATFTYQVVSTDFRTETDPVPGGVVPEGLLAGKYDAHVYGLNVTVTPVRRLYFSSSFTYSDTRMVSARNDNPSIVPYEGDVYSVLASARYVLSERTDLHAAYAFSRADYGQRNFADGLPLGLDYTRHGLTAGLTRRVTSFLTTSVRYGCFQYSEPSARGVNNYTAHGVFATAAFDWQ